MGDLTDMVSTNSGADLAPPDGGAYFDLEAPTAAAPALHVYDRDVNLVAQLSPEEQKKMAEEAVERYQRDWDSGKKFRERRVRQVELFAGVLPEKPPGHEKVAQIHLSIIAQSVIILHATIHGQLFPPSDYIYGAKALTPMADERVRRMGLHMNWQVTTKIVEYLPSNDKGMVQWLVYGNMFDCWYYDPIEERPCYEIIHTDDLVMPYTARGVRYDLADIPRVTRKLHKYQHEIEQLADKQFYANTDQLFADDEVGDMVPADKPSDADAPMQRAEDRIQGLDRPPEDPHAPRLIVDQHCWLKLPGDKRQRPVIVTVDAEKKVLLRLVLREDEDPRDRARFNREQDANQARFAAQQAQHVADTQAWMSTASSVAMDDGSVQLLQPVGEPPQAPEPPAAPRPVKIVPVNWFTKYPCIPNPEGPYDFGVGYLLEGDNIAADTLMSQYVSALTLALFPTFLYSKQAKMARGEFRLRMGEGVEVPLPPDSLQKAFFQFQFPPPPAAVPSLIQSREQAGRDLVGASSILTGDDDTSNQTATEVQIKNASARTNLAEMGNRFNKARQNSMRNLARINAKTLDPIEYFAVTMPGSQNVPPEMLSVARSDYLEDFQVTFNTDPRLASQPQRVQEAAALMGQLLQIPPGSVNPAAHQAAIKMALVGYLRALGRDDMANLVENSPDMPPPGPPALPPGGPNAPGKPGEGSQNVRRPAAGPPQGMGGPPGDAAVPEVP
jgi:hypothetical protein